MTIPTIASYPMPGAERLPANRVDWRPDPARAVLLIHDMQDYFLAFYDRGQAPVPELIGNIRALREACDGAGVPVVYTAQPGEQSASQRGLLQPWWGPGITAKPELTPVASEIAPRPQDTVLTKWRYSAFVSSDLRERMRAQGRDQLIVCGIYAHIGCMMTVADAFMHDIQPFLIGDAVADFSAQEHAMALDYVSRRCGVVIGRAACEAALGAGLGLPRSLAQLRSELAQIIEVPLDEVGSEDNPFEIGLDSIRLMSLLERWSAGGERIGLVELAERASVADWWQLIDSRRAA
ncbi:isochorismatase [Lysobacter sp. BMK333-48F3]|uniref:isochorismatase family protein n=1 Tax=Lysobacter sp. BMK333-48F3 TaxID=2867962 RepID=UPI001C8C6ED9|nr:isochorismatase [Lysobacter sp. BMK333-48F3]MBX9403241.1 isochorismatase [Lysobacter sp. BMK333-48F3]